LEEKEKTGSYVTKSEMYKHTHSIQNKLSEKIHEVDDKHTDKNNELRVMFAQINETNKHIAENTKRTAESLENFGEEVKKNASELADELKSTNSKVSGIAIRTEKLEENKASQIAILVACIGGALTLAGTIIRPIIESFFM
jgi:predicted phage gp36 major capsid-like protein